MKLKAVLMAIAFACAAIEAVLVTVVVAQNAVPPAAIALGPGSVLWLEGKSNLHDFESRSTAVKVSFGLAPGTVVPTTVAQLEALLRASGVHGLDVEVPVTSLRSSKEGLDKNLWKDLRGDEYPAIQFHLNHYTLGSKESKIDHIVHHGSSNLMARWRSCQLSNLRPSRRVLTPGRWQLLQYLVARHWNRQIRSSGQKNTCQRWPQQYKAKKGQTNYF